MRYLLISDIHSNLEALLAVLEASYKDGISECLCVGDVVGYGADPSECVKIIREVFRDKVVAGNHDLGAAGAFDVSSFSPSAKVAIEWTGKMLNSGELDYLKSLKLVYETHGATLVHGSLVAPEEFNYVLSVRDAANVIKIMQGEVCFIGHSHVPGIFYTENKKTVFAKGPKIKLERGKKYVVNVGSVGQPRDGDPRACFAVYDTDAGAIEIRRVQYDIKKTQDKIIKAGLPGYLATRLAEGR